MLYGSILLTIIIFLFSRGNIGVLLDDSANGSDVTMLQIICFFTFKIILNIPFGFINWMSDKYLWTTVLFLIPNSLFMAWLVAKLYPAEKKNIIKAFYYVFVVLVILNFMSISLGFIQGTIPFL